MYWRFRAGLKRFLGSALSADDCRRIVAGSLERRDHNFLQLIRRAVFEFPSSPYLPLLRRAGVEYGDLETLVRQSGLEHALERLLAADVWISIDEFKGKQPISRPGFERRVKASDFDNPLLAREFELMTGGTGGARRRLPVDLDLLVFESAAQHLFLAAHGLLDHPIAVWRSVPPGSSGIKHALRAAKLGHPLARWFDLAGDSPARSWKSMLFLRTAVSYGKRHGGVVPVPEPVSPAGPMPVCRWLADCVQAGLPGILSCPASAAVRVCALALENGLDIGGTVLWVGGEPVSPAKHEVFRAAAATSVNGWSLAETGPIAMGCARRQEIDEVHILHSKVAVIPRAAPPSNGVNSASLLLTTILPASPKLLLNVDSGDSGLLERRSCGCPLEDAGFPLHLSAIRSHEKLTAAGMHFLRSDLLPLVESVLPSAHGGSPVDYQLVPEEDRGESRITVIVSPAAGEIDDQAVVTTVLNYLGKASRGEAMMAEHWRLSGTLRVKRRLPYVTAVGKTPPIWSGDL